MYVKALYAEVKCTLDIRNTIVTDHNSFILYEIVAVEQNLVHIGVGLFASNIRAYDNVGKVFADAEHIDFGRSKVMLSV